MLISRKRHSMHTKHFIKVQFTAFEKRNGDPGWVHDIEVHHRKSTNRELYQFSMEIDEKFQTYRKPIRSGCSPRSSVSKRNYQRTINFVTLIVIVRWICSSLENPAPGVRCVCLTNRPAVRPKCKSFCCSLWSSSTFGSEPCQRSCHHPDDGLWKLCQQIQLAQRNSGCNRVETSDLWSECC